MEVKITLLASIGYWRSIDVFTIYTRSGKWALRISVRIAETYIEMVGIFPCSTSPQILVIPVICNWYKYNECFSDTRTCQMTDVSCVLSYRRQIIAPAIASFSGSVTFRCSQTRHRGICANIRLWLTPMWIPMDPYLIHKRHVLLGKWVVLSWARITCVTGPAIWSQKTQNVRFPLDCTWWTLVIGTLCYWIGL